tara:strand:- start:234 stop:755 length:522 start_codon:yes stop_codon:yes gene_type:complete
MSVGVCRVPNFCPEWVFSICSANTAVEFLSEDTSIESCAKKYVTELNTKYSQIEAELISLSAQELLLFLSEIDAGDSAVPLLNDYIFNRLKFEATRKPRKIKSMFGSAFDPTKTQEYSAEKCTKLFRAMVFGLRSKANPSAPSGWNIAQEQNLDWFGKLLIQKTSILDTFLDD